MKTWSLPGVALWLGLLGCSRTEPSPAPAEPSFTPGSLATPTAFALAPSAHGAVLAWAPAGTGQLLTARFDVSGRALAATTPDAGEPHAVQMDGSRATPIAGAGEVSDLALADAAAGLALAWRESQPGGARLRAAWMRPDGAARSFDLGPTWQGEPSSRGALALAARGATALLLARAGEVPCASAGDTACSAFQFFRLSSEAAQPTGLPLEVPEPCAAWSAQLVPAPARPGAPSGGERDEPARFDYAICSVAGGAAKLTAFSIRTNPAYAAAEETLSGCTPLGAGRFAGESTFVAACGAERRAARWPAAGGAPVVRNIDERGLICNANGAAVRWGAEWLLLREPLGGLELLATDDLAPPGSRAVWTGGALLVARAEAGRLVLARHVCRGSSLMELSGPFEPAG